MTIAQLAVYFGSQREEKEDGTCVATQARTQVEVSGIKGKRREAKWDRPTEVEEDFARKAKRTRPSCRTKPTKKGSADATTIFRENRSNFIANRLFDWQSFPIQ